MPGAHQRNAAAMTALAAISIAIGCNALTGAGELDVTALDADAASSSSSSASGSVSSASSSSASSTSTSGSTGSNNDGGSSGTTTTSSSSSGAVDCVKAEADLVAYYPLDEASGTAVKDCSGHGHDGVVLSMAPGGSWGAGKFGGSFTTGDNAGCIDLGTPDELRREDKDFSVAAWVRAAAFGTASLSYYILGRSALPQSSGWRVGTDPGVWSIKLFDATNGLLLTTSPVGQPVDQWMHVAATFKATGSMILYVNGAVSASRPMTTISADNQATVRIGCRGDNNGFFHGSIDEVRIYARELSAADVATLAAKIP